MVEHEHPRLISSIYLGCCSLHGWTASTHWEKDEGSSRGGRQNYCQAQRTGNCQTGDVFSWELKVYGKLKHCTITTVNGNFTCFIVFNHFLWFYRVLQPKIWGNSVWIMVVHPNKQTDGLLLKDIKIELTDSVLFLGNWYRYTLPSRYCSCCYGGAKSRSLNSSNHQSWF